MSAAWNLDLGIVLLIVIQSMFFLGRVLLLNARSSCSLFFLLFKNLSILLVMCKMANISGMCWVVMSAAEDEWYKCALSEAVGFSYKSCF